MFSQVFVCPQLVGVCLPTMPWVSDTPLPDTVNKRVERILYAFTGVCLFIGWSAFPQCHGIGRPPPIGRAPLYRQIPLRYGQLADGMHPTGMLTCLSEILKSITESSIEIIFYFGNQQTPTYS